MKIALISLLLVCGLLTGFVLFCYLLLCVASVFSDGTLSETDRLWAIAGITYVLAAILFFNQYRDKLFAETDNVRKPE